MTPTKILSFFLCFCLIFEQSLFAQTIDLSHYFVRNPAQTVHQSDKFRPLHLRYISYDNQANDFKILLDKGDFFNQKTEKPKNEKTLELENTTQELMKYFFIGLSLPNEKFWVNLRPDSPDNILDPDLEKTDIGRIFLEADLQLKKDTASFTSPQNPEGKAYWDKLYKKAGELFGSENITIPTITRPWIVPNEIIIREAPDNAYIYKATLKVMLEEDYLRGTKGERRGTAINYSFNDPRLKELNEYSTQLIKEVIIPKLTYAVNTAKRYAQLRQVYYSLILAQWFKQKYGSVRSTSAQRHLPAGRQARAPVNSYVDQIDSGNLTNLASSQSYDKQDYFQQYQKSFKDGEYNLQEPVYTPMGQSIRRYMSGGITVSSAMVVSSFIGAKEDNIPKASYIIPGNSGAKVDITAASPIQGEVLRELTIEEQKLFEEIKAYLLFSIEISSNKEYILKSLIISLAKDKVSKIFDRHPSGLAEGFKIIFDNWDNFNKLLIKLGKDKVSEAFAKDPFWFARSLKIIFDNWDNFNKLLIKLGKDKVSEAFAKDPFWFAKSLKIIFDNWDNFNKLLTKLDKDKVSKAFANNSTGFAEGFKIIFDNWDNFNKLLIKLGKDKVSEAFAEDPVWFVRSLKIIFDNWDNFNKLLIKLGKDKVSEAFAEDPVWFARSLKIIFENWDILINGAGPYFALTDLFVNEQDTDSDKQEFSKLSSQAKDLVIKCLFSSSYGFIENIRSLCALKGMTDPDIIFSMIADNKKEGWELAKLGVNEIGGKLQIYGDKPALEEMAEKAREYFLKTAIHGYQRVNVLTIILPVVVNARQSYEFIKALFDRGVIAHKGVKIQYQATFGGKMGNLANNIALSHWLSSSDIFPLVKDPFKYPNDREGLLVSGGGVTSKCHPGYPKRNGERFDFRGRVLTERTIKGLAFDMAMLQYLVFGLGEFDKNKNSKAGKAFQKFISGIFELLDDFNKDREEYAKLLIDKEGVKFSEERKCMREYPFVDTLDPKKVGSWLEDNWERLYPRLKGLEGLLHTPGIGQKFFERLEKIRVKYRDTVKEIIEDGLRKEGNNISSSSAVELIGKSSDGLPSITATENDKGGIDFNALPIQTESVASSSLGALSGGRAFKGNLDEEWRKIQSVFNAGIRPSIQRISEYTAAVSSSPLAQDRIDQVRVMLADILRSDEESQKLAPAEESCKQLLRALEAE